MKSKSNLKLKKLMSKAGHKVWYVAGQARSKTMFFNKRAERTEIPDATLNSKASLQVSEETPLLFFVNNVECKVNH